MMTDKRIMLEVADYNSVDMIYFLQGVLGEEYYYRVCYDSGMVDYLGKEVGDTVDFRYAAADIFCNYYTMDDDYVLYLTIENIGDTGTHVDAIICDICEVI